MGLTTLLTLCGCSQATKSATAHLDTPEDRLAAAQHYTKMIPSELAVDAVIHELAAQREIAQREAFQRLLRHELRLRVIDEATTKALAQHFTAAEINALTAFNSSPEGRSIQNKMGAYMADVLAPLREEIARVLTMTNSALAQLQWRTRLVEAHASVEDREMTADYYFANQGTRPVSILQVASSCGCITGVANRTNYPPNYAGFVKVTFDFGSRIGAQSKYVTVRTDDPCEPEVRLQMDVQIPEIIKIEPPFAYWPIGTAPNTSEHRLTLLQPNCSIIGLTSTNPVFGTQLSTQEPGRRYTLCVTPRSTDIRALQQLDLEVAVSSNVVRHFPIFVAVDTVILAR